MKKLLMVLALVSLPTLAQAQTFTLGQSLTASWDGTAAEAAEGITVYQVRVDAGAWVANGQTVPQTRYSYNLPQNLLTLGTHVVAVRACAGAVCGGTTDELQLSITIERPRPGRPRNGTVAPTSGQALSLPRAVDIANAYATLTIDRTLTGPELAELAKRHGNGLPTRESIFRVLDAAYAELVASR